MLSFNLLVAVCLAYVCLLFLVAFTADQRARRGKVRWLRGPLVYTLSLSIYCTAWTFYGAVGYAARSGLEFVTIYLGPTLVLVGWWGLLRKLVRIGRVQRVTSIADLISSRYGKSNLLGVLVTLIAVVAAAPYIALQLQSVALSVQVFARDGLPGGTADSHITALWVAMGLAVFTVLFGTRNLASDERHHGIVMAIAVEAVVKLFALLSVGIFVVWGIAGGWEGVFDRLGASRMADWPLVPSRWAGLTFVSGAAVLTLPRMFHVLVVENSDERHLATAAWAFPAYLFAMSLFVLPIAIVGLDTMPAGANPDLFVLTLPLSQGETGLAMLAFLGGFSSATSMVIVASIALATMVSNHIVAPLWLALGAPKLRSRGQVGRIGADAADVRGVVLLARRVSVLAILAMGYSYYHLSGGGAALSAIGLISFVGVVQILPAMLGGLFWRGATARGAALGLVTGFAVWLYTLYLPSYGAAGLLSAGVIADGPWGIGWLRPGALFGVAGLDPLLHCVVWSLLLNTTAFLLGSLLSFPSPVERMQGLAFVNVFDQPKPSADWARGGPEAEDLLALSQGILGAEAAQGFFLAEAMAQGKAGFLPDTTPRFLEALERRLAGAVGAATAHAMLMQVAEGAGVSVHDLMAVASEAQQILEYSSRLEAQSEELARTARALGEANEKLTQLSIQKDAFLSQISHELRTPMTSIRAFSEILMEGGLEACDQARYAGIIHEETARLTRLLDDLLDLSVLENRTAQLRISAANLHDLIERAVQISGSTAPDRRFLIRRDDAAEHVAIFTDTDRLVQVLINLMSNARKYCDAERPELRIQVRTRGNRVTIDVADNGSGIPRKAQAIVFEKFVRLSDTARAGGAGLGLAICREIMENLGGTIAYLPGQGGAAFRLSLPLRRTLGAAA